MISAKKLIQVARKWKTTTSMRRKRISFPKINSNGERDFPKACHFVIYTVDHGRFVLPLAYLGNGIFTELLNKSEETFGLQSEGPILLPCEAEFMKYVVLLVQKGLTKETEKALLSSMETACSASFSAVHQGHKDQNLLGCVY